MSQGFKDMFKGGWHPETTASQKFSARGNIKGVNTAAEWVGHGKKDEYTDMRDHSSAPLSTLKDPASFGPPPKHVAAYGQDAANESARNGGQTGALASEKLATKPSVAPPARTQTTTQAPAAQQPPSIPSRQGLPGGREAPSPVSATSASSGPKLPPRLPPRQSTGSEGSSSPPPPYTAMPSEEASEQSGYVNQAAAGRLGKAGVSVPGFNIGGGGQSPDATGQQPAAPTSQNQMNELSSRFKKMGRSGSNESSSPAPTTSTSWSQKQSAFKTAQSFHKDPSSVSLTDARSAASTANNFRQRHGDQVAAGYNKANGFGQKYGVGLQSQQNETGAVQQPPAASDDVVAVAAAKKKPPPPPKKAALSSANTDNGQRSPSDAPPIPLASKPR